VCCVLKENNKSKITKTKDITITLHTFEAGMTMIVLNRQGGKMTTVTWTLGGFISIERRIRVRDFFIHQLFLTHDLSCRSNLSPPDLHQFVVPDLVIVSQRKKRECIDMLFSIAPESIDCCIFMTGIAEIKCQSKIKIILIYIFL